MTGLTSYALGKGYTDNSIKEIDGALAGKNCTIESIEETGAGQVVTFKWTADDGTVRRQSMTVKAAASTYTDSEGAGATVGGWNAGEKADGMSMQDAMYKLLHPYAKPQVTIGLSPAAVLYDCVGGSIASLKVTGNVTKKTDAIASVKFYFDGALLESMTEGVAGGGKFEHTHTPADPVTGANGETHEAKVVVSDGKSEVTARAVITFIGKSYCGTVDKTVESPTADIIKALPSSLKNAKAFELRDVTMTFGKILYAYPKSLGGLSMIKDELNNLNYTDSFDKSEAVVDGVDYNCYLLREPTGADGVTLKFS